MGAALCLNAQSFQEGFFLRGFNRAYQYNPAIVGENNFIGGVQWSSDQQNNVGAGNFLFPTEDGLVTAFHSSIPAETFLGNLPELSQFAGSINAGIFSYGFWNMTTFKALSAVESGMAEQYDREYDAIVEEWKQQGRHMTNIEPY